MTVPVVAFFNNKGGVGKTSLVYHLAWMFADTGRRVLAADLDPQANLTAMFLDDDRLEELWPEQGHHEATIAGCIQPLHRGVGDVCQDVHVEEIDDQRLHLLVGDLALSQFEDELSSQWPLCGDGKERAFRVESAFWRVIQSGARRAGADFVLMDLGPNLGAINRAALIGADWVVVPVVPDLFSLQGLRNLGPALVTWRGEWQIRRRAKPESAPAIPDGSMVPAGYVVMQHAVRLDRPVRAYERWAKRIPQVYSEVVARGADESNQLLGLVKHYRSLMPMAQEARKPMFHLKPADGAIGAHGENVQTARRNFAELAESLAARCGLPAPRV